MSFLYGMSIRSCIRWVEFLTLHVHGKGISLLMSLISFLPSLYAGASLQLTVGRMGVFSLWILK